MAYVSIQVKEGGITKIKVGFTVPNKVVDDWESDKQEDALFEL